MSKDVQIFLIKYMVYIILVVKIIMIKIKKFTRQYKNQCVSR